VTLQLDATTALAMLVPGRAPLRLVGDRAFPVPPLGLPQSSCGKISRPRS
jgi:hypothetical protein